MAQKCPNPQEVGPLLYQSRDALSGYVRSTAMQAALALFASPMTLLSFQFNKVNRPQEANGVKPLEPWYYHRLGSSPLSFGFSFVAPSFMLGRNPSPCDAGRWMCLASLHDWASNIHYIKVKAENMFRFLASSGVITGVVIFFITAAAWFQHLYTCFTEEKWGFLIAGAVFFPIAVVHGIGVWLGFW